MNGLLWSAVAPWVGQWLTPVWILSLGVTLGLLLVLVTSLIASLCKRGLGSNIWGAVEEGILWPVSLIAITCAIFAVFGVFLAEDPKAIARSLTRLTAAGTRTLEQTLQPTAVSDDNFDNLPTVAVPLDIRREELRVIAFQCDQNVEIRSVPETVEVGPGVKWELLANEKTAWVAPLIGMERIFPDDVIPAVFARNLSDKPAKLALEITVMPPVPEVVTIPITALCVLIFYWLYILQRLFFPRMSAVALATFKSETAQPVFLLLTIIGAIIIIMFLIIPCNTFGEDIKMMKKAGINLLLMAGILQATWAASTSIWEEIEGRTALTVLSKPLSRPSFIIGKFLGILWTLALLFITLGVLLLVVTAYKPIYDAREGANIEASWQLCHSEMTRLLPGILLAFMETIVLAAISVAISTRLPMIPNMVICLTVFVLGNLTPMIVKSGAGRFEIVKFFGQLIAAIFPVLENFSVESAVSANQIVPLSYLGVSGLYCLLFTLVALLLALILFEDADVA